ncbi:hypothetical protein ABFS82_04G213400 [Erythranthe guttata]
MHEKMQPCPMKLTHIFAVLLIYLAQGAIGTTDPNDFRILTDFRNGLENPDLLKWPGSGDDPCGPPAWPHVFCSNGRVTQIQVQGVGLKGPLPHNFNQLDKLQNLGLQRNHFNGDLPSFSGLSNLQYAYLDYNDFDTIPSDFFNGLRNVRVLALDDNPFNKTYGWSIPSDLAESTQLVNFSCSNCNIVGEIPDFFGGFRSLNMLRLSSNKLSGEIPSSFRGSTLHVLLLNDQEGGGLSGSIDIIATMLELTQVWLHGNQFTGSIPGNIGSLTSLKELNLNRNRLVGLIPKGLSDLNLESLNLDNNMFMGPVPQFKSAKVSYDSNSFCESNPGGQCAPQVSALLDFLHDLNYPEKLISRWTGNDPCEGPWWGISCNSKNEVSIINLKNLGLEGTLSPSLADLPSLLEIHLEGNYLHGVVPTDLTLLTSLRLLNLSGNNFDPPVPVFKNGVTVVVSGNPKLDPSSPPYVGPPVRPSPNEPPSNGADSSARKGSGSNSHTNVYNEPKSRVVAIILSAVAVSAFLAVVLIVVYCLKKRKQTKKKPRGGIVITPPKELPNSHNEVKIEIIDALSSFEAQNNSYNTNPTTNNNTRVIEVENLVFSIDVIRKATNDFRKENEIGRGGFGVVYKGELENGTKIAVKRTEAGPVCNKASNEFRTEISVLSEVRHRHLVSLLGYSVGGNEMLLVYEYMSQGALSRHLFHWRRLNLEPLDWEKRVCIALDVARGVEYLHNLGHQTFIHRDLKSANILLDDDFRAKVSDFGLVKLALDSERSVATRLAGTFGYLSPEYAVTGKITTKVDVFSFGVVLLELLTGLAALDERRSEEKRYLAEWFWGIKSNRGALIDSVDPALDAKEDVHESIYVVAELAGHCTARDPSNRPDMGHAVNVLTRLVEKWKPYEETERFCDDDVIGDTSLGLPQLLKGWQEEGDTRDFSGASKPPGMPDSFRSADAR